MPRNTPTFAFNQNVENVRRAVRIEEASNLQDWFGGRRSIEINEDVIYRRWKIRGLGSHKRFARRD